MMTTDDERSRASRSRRLAAAAGIMLIGLTACQQSPSQLGDSGGLSPANDVGVISTTATTVTTAVGQTCTDAWRNHGHTTQREAKAFLKQCLAAQGVEGERLDPPRVLAFLKLAIPASSPLTSVVPVDIATFCPDYVQQDAEGRASFWRALLLAMVGPESDFQTTTALWEGGELQQFSIGLLQLSYTDRRNYGGDFTNEADMVSLKALRNSIYFEARKPSSCSIASLCLRQRSRRRLVDRILDDYATIQGPISRMAHAERRNEYLFISLRYHRGLILAALPSERWLWRMRQSSIPTSRPSAKGRTRMVQPLLVF